MKKIKFNQESKLLIRKIVGKGVDVNGKVIIQTKWFEANGAINLGSMMDKTGEIVEYKYTFPQKDVFAGFFGR